MPASICRVRKASWQKRYWSKALKAEKAFWVVEEAAWAPAGGPEKAWLVLGAAVNGERALGATLIDGRGAWRPAQRPCVSGWEWTFP